MISRIRGHVLAWNSETQSVELEVGGLTYEVLLPTYSWRALEHRPQELELFTYYHVPERQPTPILIGFTRAVEREFFKKFLRVRGMGPAKAQRALAASISTIAHWIESEDRAALRELPGVGARQADQIIAELRGKVIEEAMLRDEHYAEPFSDPLISQDRAAADAIEALVNLGYARREAEEWVPAAAASEEATTEAILRAVFEQIASET